MQNHLIRETKHDNRGVKKGNFHMVRKSNMPSCLVESGFISNDEEASLMIIDKFHERCSNAIVKGLLEVNKYWRRKSWY
ncbi:N-acetylmuramoyl-L-alanine amidase family protein [Metabacillus halosaccharovorans]|uniref:N-acetylmuramoyl-L-alanine amidase family protein n=1 Tax=Metabacillus halosaccharovorans TaxID=930124 RepID=UPI003D349FCB